MAGQSKVCGECGGLNGAAETHCYRCGARFPSGTERQAHSIIESLLGSEFPITRLYVGACLLMYLVMTLDDGSFELMGGFRRSTMLRWGALRACDGATEIWRLLSPAFLHAGVLHLGMNMMGLVDLGRLLEPQFGSARYGVLLLGTVISGFLLSDVWYSDLGATAALCELAESQPALLFSYAPVTVGISGGLFGLVGALVGFLYARRDPLWKTISVRIGLYTLLFAFIFPVNNAAHLGGALLGLPLGFAFSREKKRREHDRLFRRACAALVMLSFVSVYLSQRSDTWRVQRALEQSVAERRGR